MFAVGAEPGGDKARERCMSQAIFVFEMAVDIRQRTFRFCNLDILHSTLSNRKHLLCVGFMPFSPACPAFMRAKNTHPESDVLEPGAYPS